MKATDILYEEHRIIMKVLECLQKIVTEAEENLKLDEESANAAIDFFRNFADGCHHSKEEERLFVVVEEHGIPREGGPIGVMLMEHDDGRRFITEMARVVDNAAQSDRDAIQKFAENACDLMALLRLHIDKEDQVLFPMAGQVLNDEIAEALLADFKKIESDAGGKRHSEYIRMAKQLCERYGIPFIEESQIKTIKAEFNL